MSACALLRIELERHRHAARSECGSQIARILRPHRVIPDAVHQQHGWCIGTHEIDGLRFRIVRGRPEHVLNIRPRSAAENRTVRTSRSRPRWAARAALPPRNIAGRASPGPPDARPPNAPSSTDALASRADSHPRAPAAQRAARAASSMNPGIFTSRIVAVVRHHGDIAQGRQGRADEPIVGLVAEAPAAAVPEDHQRPRRERALSGTYTSSAAADPCRTRYRRGADDGRRPRAHWPPRSARREHPAAAQAPNPASRVRRDTPPIGSHR